MNLQNPLNPLTAAAIVERVKALIPRRWFAWVAALRDAILGGVADSAAWSWSLLQYAQQQSRISTSTGVFLDLVAYDYLRSYLMRSGMDDTTFRRFIIATILKERVTRAGMMSTIVQITGNAPTIFEPWNTGDAGAYGSPLFAYGVSGGWGSLALPGQAFMGVTRGSPSGVPGVGGYGNNIGGYRGGSAGGGAIEYIGSQVAQEGITDELIYAAINATNETGVICWTQFH